MACANWLHSSTLFHASFPTTSLRRSSSFRPATSSDGRLIFSSNYQYRPPAIAVNAQARRGFSLKKKEKEETAPAAVMQFEAPLKIVLYPDPILRVKNKVVDTFDENLKKLVKEMFE